MLCRSVQTERKGRALFFKGNRGWGRYKGSRKIGEIPLKCFFEVSIMCIKLSLSSFRNQNLPLPWNFSFPTSTFSSRENRSNRSVAVPRTVPESALVVKIKSCFIFVCRASQALIIKRHGIIDSWKTKSLLYIYILSVTQNILWICVWRFGMRSTGDDIVWCHTNWHIPSPPLFQSIGLSISKWVIFNARPTDTSRPVLNTVGVCEGIGLWKTTCNKLN